AVFRSRISAEDRSAAPRENPSRAPLRNQRDAISPRDQAPETNPPPPLSPASRLRVAHFAEHVLELRGKSEPRRATRPARLPPSRRRPAELHRAAARQWCGRFVDAGASRSRRCRADANDAAPAATPLR